MKVGLLAGEGRLPAILREQDAFHHCLDLTLWPQPLGALEAVVRTLRSAGCEALCLAGGVDRSRFHTLDAGGRWVAERAGRAAGDAQLLDALIAYLEREGFTIVGAADLMPTLKTPNGVMTGELDDAWAGDLGAGLDRARSHGLRDQGQAVVRCGQDTWLHETDSGTNDLIRRAGRTDGSPKILFKAAKPQQDLRVDMPTWGPETVRQAIGSGLQALVFEADRTLALDRQDALETARQAGLTIVGVSS